MIRPGEFFLLLVALITFHFENLTYFCRSYFDYESLFLPRPVKFIRRASFQDRLNIGNPALPAYR